MDKASTTRHYFNTVLSPEDRLSLLADIQGLDTTNASPNTLQLWQAVKLLIAENADLRRLIELHRDMGHALTNEMPVTQEPIGGAQAQIDPDFAEALAPTEDELEESEEVPVIEETEGEE